MADTPQGDGNEDIVDATAETVEIRDPEPDNPPRAPWWKQPWRVYALGGVALVVIAVIALAVLQPALLTSVLGVSPDPSAGRVAILERDLIRTRSDLKALVDRLSKLEMAVDGAPKPGALASRVDALEKKIAAAPPSTATPAPTPGIGPTSDFVEGLANRIAALESARGKAPDGAAAAASPSATSNELKTALAERDKRHAALRAENEELRKAVTNLAGRIATVEKSSSGGKSAAGKSAALVLAAGQLRAALSKSTPYTAEIEAVAALSESDPTIAKTVTTLSPRADKGIATRNQLTARFDTMARRVIQAAVAPGGDGLWDRAMARLAGLVTIRRKGTDATGQTPSAMLARAEAKLSAGDLDGAAKALDPLDGAPRMAAEDWLTQAKARVAADKATAELTRYVIGRIARATPSGEPAAK